MGAAGTAGVDTGCQECFGRAIAEGLNREGGLFGRQVKMVFKDNAFAALQADPAGTAQANCTYFTEDRPVFAVIGLNGIDGDGYRACLAKRQTPLVSMTSNPPVDDRTIARFAPFFFNAFNPNWSRLMPVLVKRLVAQKYFTGWDNVAGQPSAVAPVKMGILYGSDETSRRVGPALAAEVRKAGHPTETYQYSSGGSSSEMQAAVLRFKANGVTHVTTLGVEPFFFAPVAESQRYRPRYAVHTNMVPGFTLEQTNAAQANGAMGIGWNPGVDGKEPAAKQPDPGPGAAWCRKAVKDGGVEGGGALALSFCDVIRLAVLGARAGNGLDAQAIRRGAASLGPRFPVASGFTSGITATDFTLFGAARDLQWSSQCSCLRYTSEPYPL